jgi:hypothetical protein
MFRRSFRNAGYTAEKKDPESMPGALQETRHEIRAIHILRETFAE